MAYYFKIECIIKCIIVIVFVIESVAVGIQRETKQSTKIKLLFTKLSNLLKVDCHASTSFGSQ